MISTLAGWLASCNFSIVTDGQPSPFPAGHKLPIESTLFRVATRWLPKSIAPNLETKPDLMCSFSKDSRTEQKYANPKKCVETAAHDAGYCHALVLLQSKATKDDCKNAKHNGQWRNTPSKQADYSEHHCGHCKSGARSSRNIIVDLDEMPLLWIAGLDRLRWLIVGRLLGVAWINRPPRRIKSR